MHQVRYTKRRYHENADMAKWCESNIGEGGWSNNDNPDGYDWWTNSMFGETTFAFKEEKHYTWFILRWGLGELQ